MRGQYIPKALTETDVSFDMRSFFSMRNIGSASEHDSGNGREEKMMQRQLLDLRSLFVQNDQTAIPSASEFIFMFSLRFWSCLFVIWKL